MRQLLIDFALWRAERNLRRRQFWHSVARWLNGTAKLHSPGGDQSHG